MGEGNIHQEQWSRFAEFPIVGSGESTPTVMPPCVKGHYRARRHVDQGLLDVRGGQTSLFPLLIGLEQDQEAERPGGAPAIDAPGIGMGLGRRIEPQDRG